MKKTNLFLSVLICMAAFFAFSCSEQDEQVNEASTNTVEFGLEIQKADFINTKSGALSGDDELVPYCDEDLVSGVVVATYDISFKDATGNTVRTTNSDLWVWDVSNVEGGTDGLARLSELKQIDFSTDETVATVTFSDFRIYDATADATDFTLNSSGMVVNSGASILKFITPASSSAYAAYVTTPVDYSFDIDLYSKKYMKMDVLCFDEEEIPSFGFAWTDFEIITGDEICYFLNCIGTNASNQHQVLSADITANYLTEDGWIAYWEGINYTLNDDLTAVTSNAPNCVPCPGNWKDEHLNGDGGFMLSITLLSDSTEFELYITEEQIQAFIDADVTFPNWPINGKDGEGEIDFANEIPFIHYVFDECVEDSTNEK